MNILLVLLCYLYKQLRCDFCSDKLQSGRVRRKDNSEISIGKLVERIAWRRDLGNCRKKRISKVSKTRGIWRWVEAVWRWVHVTSFCAWHQVPTHSSNLKLKIMGLHCSSLPGLAYEMGCESRRVPVPGEEQFLVSKPCVITWWDPFWHYGKFRASEGIKYT